jgi:hypothetical protein
LCHVLKPGFQWERITASRIAIIYFVYSILNCTLQVVFQAQAFSINVQADNFLSGLIRTGNLSLPTGFFVLDSTKLHFCDHVPNTFSTESCQVVWDGEIGGTGNVTSDSLSGTESVNSPTPSTSSSLAPKPTVVRTPTITSLTVTPTAHALVHNVSTQSHHDKRLLPQPQINVNGTHLTSSNGQTGVRSVSLEVGGQDINLSSSCLVNLKWPVQT